MTTPKTKRLILAAVASLGGSATAAGAVACNTSTSEGFNGDIAYDGGYDAADAAGDADSSPAHDAGGD